MIELILKLGSKSYIFYNIVLNIVYLYHIIILILAIPYLYTSSKSIKEEFIKNFNYYREDIKYSYWLSHIKE